MRGILSLAPLALLLAPAASAGDADFKAVVRAVESDLGIHRTHIPLFGTAMFFVRVARPEGVEQLDMAIFNDADTRPDFARFEKIMHDAAGGRWTPMIRVRDRNGDELTYIYVKVENRDWKMILATFEGSEAVLIHLKLTPEALREILDEPRHAGKSLAGK